MNAQQIRTAYVDFCKKNGHVVIPRALLVPYNDPTTLFTGSGMQPLIPYLLGETHPKGTRLTNSQTCLRAQDIEEIGDNRHTTFFEMLGNWSLGDYFKKEQLNWFWQFLTQEIGLDPQRIYVSCFIGDEAANIPKDTESAAIWTDIFKGVGIDAKQVDIGTEQDGAKLGEQGGRIFFYGEKNWWCRAGKAKDMPAGEPGGPDSEVFYLFPSVAHNPEYGEHCHVNCDCGRYIELGNSVFMEYLKTETGFEKLPRQNVDYGGGLERIAAAALDTPDVFKISVMWPIVEKLEALSGKKYDSHTNAMRVIADHLRGAAFLAVDGVKPSNKEQGYVMRRLVRRAVRFAFDLGIEQNFLQEVVPVIASLYEDDFPEVATSKDDVIATLVREEKAFRQTLRKGIQQLDKLFSATVIPASDNLRSANYMPNRKIAAPIKSKAIPREAIPESSQNKNTGSRIKSGMTQGEVLFTLYDTYGFPVELSAEEAFKRGIVLSDTWREEFDAKMKEQRERSQTASKGTFKGGLGGQTMQHKKYHTATHLMYQALRDVLGDHVVQNGSNITEERLRFDFSHPQKVTPEELKKVEDIVNEQIQKDLKVSWAEYPTKVAREEMGALGQFGDRYGDTVKVYKMIADGADKPFSFEICGGPHVDHTTQLAEDGKRFKIVKEEASSAGIRRIKAVLA
ncbi:MAG TPA: alanine--tRNA ligase-related protein [Candidatus Saccharimonadales bacterium]|nr:alanine--tRNA ligase-related protein [Candidatus Saccharimonadales bacterium]